MTYDMLTSETRIINEQLTANTAITNFRATLTDIPDGVFSTLQVKCPELIVPVVINSQPSGTAYFYLYWMVYVGSNRLAGSQYGNRVSTSATTMRFTVPAASLQFDLTNSNFADIEVSINYQLSSNSFAHYVASPLDVVIECRFYR